MCVRKGWFKEIILCQVTKVKILRKRNFNYAIVNLLKLRLLFYHFSYLLSKMKVHKMMALKNHSVFL